MMKSLIIIAGFFSNLALAQLSDIKIERMRSQERTCRNAHTDAMKICEDLCQKRGWQWVKGAAICINHKPFFDRFLALDGTKDVKFLTIQQGISQGEMLNQCKQNKDLAESAKTYQMQRMDLCLDAIQRCGEPEVCGEFQNIYESDFSNYAVSGMRFPGEGTKNPFNECVSLRDSAIKMYTASEDAGRQALQTYYQCIGSTNSSDISSNPVTGTSRPAPSSANGMGSTSHTPSSGQANSTTTPRPPVATSAQEPQPDLRKPSSKSPTLEELGITDLRKGGKDPYKGALDNMPPMPRPNRIPSSVLSKCPEAQVDRGTGDIIGCTLRWTPDGQDIPQWGH